MAFLPATGLVTAQDLKYVRKQLSILCGPEYYGRGYFRKGDSLAAVHIAGELSKDKVKPFGDSYFQPYSFGVNIFDEAGVKINGNDLNFGRDFMMDPESGNFTGTFRPLRVGASLLKHPRDLFDSLDRHNGEGEVILLDSTGLNNPGLYNFFTTMCLNGDRGIRALIEITPQIGIGLVGKKERPAAHLRINPGAVPETLDFITLNIRDHVDPDYSTRNVIGYIPGKTDHFIVFTAHYDGIGSYGNGNLFPAASDNGSGTSMVLDLARYFSKGKQPYYSIAFMLFSGEEAGLKGSSYYVDHPVFPLDQIRLVINLDMVGTGQDGVILFNGTQRPREAAIVQSINDQNHYMKTIDVVAGKANSDHYPFHEKEVPAIFFLTKGPSGGGHNVTDSPDKLPLYGYHNLFRLMMDLVKELQEQEVTEAF